MGWYANASDEVKQRHRERARAYYLANREAVLAKQREQKAEKYRTDLEWRETLKAKHQVTGAARNAKRNRWGLLREWRKNHPDEAREQRKRWNRTRAARERLANTSETIDYDALLRAARGLCGLCLKPLNGHDDQIDHIVPLSKGGKHAMANMHMVHGECNRKKGTKLRVN